MRTWLKSLRESTNMTQADMAKHLDISREYYVRIENGERQKDLDLSIAAKLSKLFNVTVDYIVEQEGVYKDTA